MIFISILVSSYSALLNGGRADGTHRMQSWLVTRSAARRYPNPTRAGGALLWGFALWLVSADAAAQKTDAPVARAPTAPPAPAADAGTVTPPELIHFVEAPYPADAKAEGKEVRVLLKLTIDAAGAVTNSDVVRGAGASFDEVASGAALQFRFAPARRGEVAVASRVHYEYVFPAPQPEPVPEPAPVVSAVVAVPAGSDAAPAAQAGTQSVNADASTAMGDAAAVESDAVDVTVRGRTDVERLRESAQAVHVIDTTNAKRQTADLGEVLARSQGVGVRRSGGLGSDARISLNGLTDDQIRFFVDGIPLELMGYPFGIANVPVNLVDRIEVYRGVVPVRFGADALGGAVNLVTDDSLDGTHGSASYQAGSFGTQRLSLGLSTIDEPTGFFVRAGGFYDYADNDYPVDVEVPDERGRLSPARAYRFHDEYEAGGANVEAGVADQPWAKRLSLRAFATGYGKELQHNVVMTVPYGEVDYGEFSAGGTAHYENVFDHQYRLEVVGGYTYSAFDFLDVAECVYDWFGQCVRERRIPGEIEARPRDQVYWDHSGYWRLNGGWFPHHQHKFNLSVSPTYTTRTGDERRQSNPEARDPLTAQRDILSFVSGVEYELDILDDALENIVFIKDYVQVVRAEEPLAGDIYRERHRDTHEVGIGDGLRYRFYDWLYAKLSYEWATRLPTPEEVFGDAALVQANLDLAPETSHNANLGFTLDARDFPGGDWRADINCFLRDADELITLLGNDRFFTYQNVYSARSLGFELAGGWTSPGEYLALDANVTHQEFRNTSSEGTFSAFEGDRIPNRPYLFANGTARVQVREVSAVNDELALEWNTRYVHEFFRGWESAGLRRFKQVVDSQLLHSLALVYLVTGTPTLSFTAEAQNITDEPAYDFFGVQRPGRAFYFKTTAGF